MQYVSIMAFESSAENVNRSTHQDTTISVENNFL